MWIKLQRRTSEDKQSRQWNCIPRKQQNGKGGVKTAKAWKPISVLFLLSLLQFFFPSSCTLGCLRMWQVPLHFLVSGSAYPHYVLCLLLHCLVGQS